MSCCSFVRNSFASCLLVGWSFCFCLESRQHHCHLTERWALTEILDLGRWGGGSPVLISNPGNSVILKKLPWSLFFHYLLRSPIDLLHLSALHTLLPTSVSVVVAVWFLTIRGERSGFVTVLFPIRLLTAAVRQFSVTSGRSIFAGASNTPHHTMLFH